MNEETNEVIEVNEVKEETNEVNEVIEVPQQTPKQVPDGLQATKLVVRFLKMTIPDYKYNQSDFRLGVDNDLSLIIVYWSFTFKPPCLKELLKNSCCESDCKCLNCVECLKDITGPKTKLEILETMVKELQDRLVSIENGL